MIYLPVTLFLFVILLLLLPFIWFFLAIDVVEIAAAKLGFSRSFALLRVIQEINDPKAGILRQTISLP